MDTIQKIAIFKEVAANARHPSALIDLIPQKDSTEPNFIQFAVEHIVSERLQQASTNQRSFRFKIVETKETDEMEQVSTENGIVERHKQKTTEIFTDWMPEVSQFSASMAMGDARQHHPSAAISIERK